MNKFSPLNKNIRVQKKRNRSKNNLPCLLTPAHCIQILTCQVCLVGKCGGKVNEKRNKENREPG